MAWPCANLPKPSPLISQDVSAQGAAVLFQFNIQEDSISSWEAAYYAAMLHVS